MMQKAIFMAADSGDTQQHLIELTQWVASMKSAGNTVALLMDSAMADLNLKTWPGASFLYDDTRWAPLGELSPVLIELDSADSPLLRRALVLAKGIPMLSLVATTLPIAKLIAVWREQIAVQDSDGEELLLRWADTRCSIYLPKALSARNWQQLSGPLEAWWVINRHGQICPLPVFSGAIGSENADAQAIALTLTEEELSNLIAFAEPDALLNVVAEQVPELLPEHKRAETHNLIADACALARRHGVTGMRDMLALAIFALGEGPTWLLQADLPRAMQAAALLPGSLAKELEVLA